METNDIRYPDALRAIQNDSELQNFMKRKAQALALMVPVRFLTISGDIKSEFKPDDQATIVLYDRMIGSRIDTIVQSLKANNHPL